VAITIARDEIRETILDATNRLLSRYGYRKMTMEDVAVEAGIGKGTIYLCFPSKEEVALSTIDRLVERLLERMREIAAGPEEPREKLRRLLVERVVYRFDHRSHGSQSIDELVTSLRTSFLARRKRYFEAEAAVLTEVIEEGRTLGVFDIDDSQVIGRAFVTATNGLLPSSLSAAELENREQVAARSERIAHLLLYGLTRPLKQSAAGRHDSKGGISPS